MTNRTLLEKKQDFITALGILEQVPVLKNHTFVTDDDNIPRPMALLVKWVVAGGSGLVSEMGNDAFYSWLDRFLRATSEERIAMWSNGGLWQ